MTERPFFRTDLVSRPLADGGQRFVEVTDPDSGNSFRFYEIEYAIACAMNGDRDVNGLVEWAKIELGLEPSPSELQTVIGTLEDLGYLGVEAASPAADARSRSAPAPQAAAPAAARPAATAPRTVTPPSAPAPMAARGGDEFQLGAPGRSPLERSQPASRPEADDVELGFAGRSPSAPARPEPPAPAEDIDLGLAGNAGLPDPDAIQPSIHDRVTAQRPATEPEREDFDGSELSVNLGDHIPVRADDVKEAVRASKVMAAVDPDELPPEAPEVRDNAAARREPSVEPDRGAEPMNKTIMGMPAPTLPAAPAAPAAAGGKPHITVAKQRPSGETTPPHAVATAPTVPVTALKDVPQPAAKKKRANTPAPVPLPEQPAAISEKLGAGGAAAEPGAEPARKSGAMGLILFLLLLVVAGGAFAYWWLELREDGSEAQSSTAPAPRPDPTPAPPPGPVRITATLEAGPSEEREVTAPRPGKVAWVAESGGDLAEGAPVAKLDGFQAKERELAAAEESQRRYQERLDQATSKGDKSGMRRAEADVKRKQSDIDRLREELAPFLVAAPIGGVVEPSVKAKAQVKEGDVIATIQAQGSPQATFTVPADRTLAAGDEVTVASTADAALSATCMVESAEAGRVTVECPSDSGIAPGTEIELK